MIRPRRSFRLFASALAIVAVPACGAGTDNAGNAGDAGDDGETQAANPAEVTITVTDTSYEVAGTVEAEPVHFTLQNEGKAAHPAFFGKLNEGVTPQQVQKSFQKNPEAVLRLITVAGSLPEAKPGATSEGTIQFLEGEYLIVNPEAKGPPPTGFFTVSAATGDPVAAPQADFTIEAGDFYFEVDNPVAGESLVEVSNVGKQSHEVIISPKGSKDEEEGQFTLAPAPGSRLWVTMNLEPGDYTAMCFFPDLKSGKPHIKLGMRTNFTVE